MNTLKIVTYNTWNCQGALQKRLDLMASELCDLKPDLVLLQEVFAEAPTGLNVADHLAEALGMTTAFIPARRKLRVFQDAPVLCHSGLAVLSRGEVLDNVKLNLPQDERDGERVAQLVTLCLDDLDILVANTHLTHLEDAGDLRGQELDVLRAHIRNCPDHDIVIIGGDMNAEGTDTIFNALKGFVSFPPPPSETTTLNPVHGQQPTAGIIDHLFVSTNALVLDGRTRMALDSRDNAPELFPSDHKAVVLELAVHVS